MIHVPEDADVKAETRALLERAAKHFEFPLDIKKMGKKKSISFGELDCGRTLFKALGYLERDEVYKAALVLSDLVPDLLEHVGRTSADKLIHATRAADVLESTQLAILLQQNAERWRRAEHGNIIDELKETKLFSDKELRDSVEVWTSVKVDDVFEEDYVRVYKLKKGSAELPRDAKFKVMDSVQVSRDLDGYIRAAHYLSAKAPGVVVFVPFFKVEERLDLSFWSFFIVYEDHVWVATDQKEFHNPHNKESTRRTDRVRDNKLENMWLPDVFTKLEKKRSKSREVAAFGGITRMLTVPLKDFHPTERFFLIRLAERIVRKCLREELETAVTMGMHSERLLLEHKGAVPDRTKELDGWNKDVQAHVADLLSTVPETTTRALVPMDYSIVVQSKTYDRNWLGTPKQLEALSHWTVVDARREQLQKHFTSLKAREEKDGNELERLLHERSAKLIDLAYSAQKVGWAFTAVEQFGLHNAKPGARIINLFSGLWVNDSDARGSYGALARIGLAPGTEKDLSDRWKKYRAQCHGCTSSVKHPARMIYIRHWEQLAYILDGKRDLIPPYYRAYRAHNFVPYHGNSILNNTHPLALLDDPCTRNEPNGMTIAVYGCGNCSRKLSKGKPEKLVIDGGKFVDPKEVRSARKAYTYGW